mgnify:CR=1 FL=1
MPNPFVEAIAEQVSKATGLAVAEVEDLLETPPNPEMGDYALPCFTLAKTVRKSPNLIAEELSSQVEIGDTITEVRPAGPYLNFFVSKIDLVMGTMEKVFPRSVYWPIQRSISSIRRIGVASPTASFLSPLA